MIMMRAELYPEIVRIWLVITPRKLPHNFVGFAIQQTNSEIDVRIVVENPQFGLLCCRRPLIGIALRKFRCRRRALPCAVVQHSIDDDLLGCTDSMEHMILRG